MRMEKTLRIVFTSFVAANATGGIKVTFPPSLTFWWCETAYAQSGFQSSNPTSNKLLTQVNKNSLIISGFESVDAETLISFDIRHIQNPPLQSFLMKGGTEDVDFGICIGNTVSFVGIYDTRDACRQTCVDNLNCLYFSYCETYDVVPIGYTKVGHFNIISAGNSLYYNMESLQTGGAIGLEYLKKDLTIGDRYCVDVVALNVDNMGGYLWIDGGVSGAENEFSNIAFTSITKCFKASSTEVRYGLRIANAILHGIIRLKSIQVSKMSSKTYSCQTSHLRNQCIHYDKCTAASTGIPTPLASDQDALSLCLLRNQWKNETEIGVEVADLTTSEAVNALKV